MLKQLAKIKLQENKNENDLIFLSWVLSHSHFIFRINDEVNVLYNQHLADVDILWRELPESYDEQLIDVCRDNVYEYIYTRFGHA